jgi:chromosome segregation ATPase
MLLNFSLIWSACLLTRRRRRRGCAACIQPWLLAHEAEAKLAKDREKFETYERETRAKLEREAASISERETAISEREGEFEGSIKAAYDDLREYYDRLKDVDRKIRHRLLACSNMLNQYNPQLQELPTWEQLKAMIRAARRSVATAAVSGKGSAPRLLCHHRNR